MSKRHIVNVNAHAATMTDPDSILTPAQDAALTLSQKKRGRPRKAPPAEPAEPAVSAHTRKLATAVRASFMGYVEKTVSFVQTRAELATPFMRAFAAFKKDTSSKERPRGLGIADFVRQFFDETVPTDRDEYKAHKSYQAADYLARLYRSEHKPKRPKGPLPVTPLEAMAKLIAAVLPLLPTEQVPKLWEAVERDLHWAGRRLENLRASVEEATPLVALRPPRGAGGMIPQLRIAAPREPASEPHTGTHG